MTSTTLTFQIAIDSADPHLLAKFWAAAVDYEIEDNGDQIRHLIELGHASTDDAVEIDGRLAWRTAVACNPKQSTGPRLLFQAVPEPKTCKNRVHLDLHVGEHRDAEVARLIGLGATYLWDGAEGPHTWVTLADPEGNEFCVA